jgi:hypothetical protein
MQPAATEKNIRLLSSLSPDAPEIEGDTHQLERVLFNLVFNAIKFTPADGSVTLSTAREQDWIVIRVTDTGIGIDPTHLPRIFERFWQVDASAQRKYQGAGIGLSLVREQLRLRNFEVDSLDLTVARQIPEKAALLIAVAPQAPFNAKEQELLRQYLSNSAGRLLLFLAPGTKHGLDDLLLDWGTLVDDDVIYDTGAENVTEDGELVISCDEHRSAPRNKQGCADRLRDLVAGSLIAPRVRKATRPGRGARERRLGDKRADSERKQRRRGWPNCNARCAGSAACCSA